MAFGHVFYIAINDTLPILCRLHNDTGQVAEWLIALVSKTGMGATPSGVRIPPCPPLSLQLDQIGLI